MKYLYEKENIERAKKFLKNTKDAFYKDATVWEVISKYGNREVPNLEILEMANKLDVS